MFYRTFLESTSSKNNNNNNTRTLNSFSPSVKDQNRENNSAKAPINFNSERSTLV